MHENKKMKIFIFIGTWLIIMYAPENDIYIICIATNNDNFGSDSNLLIVFYVQIMPDDLVMQLHRF